MEVRQELLLDLMATPDVRFAIPLYQRAYSWGELQCEELWRDVLRAARGQREHFVGTVLHTEVEAPDGGRIWYIVDGQQRIVTMTLLLLALASYMRIRDLAFFGMDADALLATYVGKGDARRLTPAAVDQDTLFALADGTALPEHPSRHIIRNHAFFTECMADEAFDPELLWRGLRSLLAIGLCLGGDDNPQAVFESLNSKGIPLTTADLVRNYLLTAESRREQSRLYTEYWEPMQDAFGDDPGSLKLNTSIEAWLNVRCHSMHWDDDHTPFFVFKVHCEDEYDGTVEDLLRELRGFAVMWAENFRYHAVKKYRTYDWALNGPKTLVSDRPLVKCEDEEVYEFYRRHYGINPKATW